MIYLQTRKHADEPWRNVHGFARVTPAQIDVVRRAKFPARLHDCSADEFLAHSLPALGIPVDRLKPEDFEAALKAFG
jgi:hypothetical protein